MEGNDEWEGDYEWRIVNREYWKISGANGSFRPLALLARRMVTGSAALDVRPAAITSRY
jgi:hypothetical protein